MPRPEQEIAPGRGCAAALSSAPAEAGPRAAAPPPTRTPAEGIAEAERLLTEERARIGSDLHDLVIRRLFAVSLKLGGARAMIEHEEAGRRVEDAISELDETVKLIRAVVFALEHKSASRGRATERPAGG